MSGYLIAISFRIGFSKTTSVKKITGSSEFFNFWIFLGNFQFFNSNSCQSFDGRSQRLTNRYCKKKYFSLKKEKWFYVTNQRENGIFSKITLVLDGGVSRVCFVVLFHYFLHFLFSFFILVCIFLMTSNSYFLHFNEKNKIPSL